MEGLSTLYTLKQVEIVIRKQIFSFSGRAGILRKLGWYEMNFEGRLFVGNIICEAVPVSDIRTKIGDVIA